MKKIIYVLTFLTLISLMIMAGCGSQQPEIRDDNALTIATFHESRYLEAAARRYEELNEGVTVKIYVYAEETDRDISKYSQIINTALMSGNGEDIIDVSYLAWAKLAEKDKLLDLNGKINFAPGEYYQNVLDAYMYNGERYAIPLNFAFTVFRFYEDEPSKNCTVDGLLAIADRYPDTPLFHSSSGLSPTELVLMVLGLNFNEFIDVKNKEAYIDEEDFISLLTKIGSISENLRFPEIGEAAVMLEDIIYNPSMSSAGTGDFTDMFLLTNDKGESLFETVGFLPAVNAGSTKQELAIDFMQFLISEEMQASSELMFNPVNRKASDEMAALILAAVQSDGHAPEGFHLENNIAIFNNLAEQLAVAEDSDFQIRDFMRDELPRYFKGEVSAEQAAKNLQARLNTYLKE